MKNYNCVFAALACVCATPAVADPEFYGRAFLSLEYTDVMGPSIAVDQDGEAIISDYRSVEQIELVNNSSRVGVKGEETIHDGLDVIYQMEYEAYFDDAETFSQRNIFVGLRSDFGTVIAGHFDTPLKSAQYKVDVFGDMRGDIKNMITINDNRESNSVMYTTPAFNGAKLNIAHIASELDVIDNGISASLTYQNEGLYVAGAMEQDVEIEFSEARRVVAQYNFAQFQVGALYETYEDPWAGSESGWLASGVYRITNDWAVKAQYGQSDIIYDGGDTLSVGVDYIFTQKFRTLVFATRESSDDDLADNTYAGVGVDFKF